MTQDIIEDTEIDEDYVDDRGIVAREEIIRLAKKYRDQLLDSLKVTGVVSSGSFSAPGEKIREIPVESQSVSHPSYYGGSATHRIVTDVRDYTGDSEVISSEDTEFLTIRRTVGRAAQFSSATLAFGWETIPTPREVKIAEYLYSLDDRDLKRCHYIERGVKIGSVSHGIIRAITPTNELADKHSLWMPVEQTGIGNVMAIEKGVTALKRNNEDDRYHLVRYEKFEGRDDHLRHRLETDFFAAEHYFDNSDGYGSESWDDIYIGRGRQKADYMTVNALGKIEVEADSESTAERLEEIPDELLPSTQIFTIPELVRPEFVLDVPPTKPADPTEANGGTSELDQALDEIDTNTS
jgi:hypothetical protein